VGDFSPWVGGWNMHSPSSRAKVKKVWSFTFTPTSSLHDIMLHMDNFTLYFFSNTSKTNFEQNKYVQT